MPEEPARSRGAVSTDLQSGMSITGLAALDHFGLIRFAGEDAQAFLHGQLSCDVNALSAGHAVYGSYNTPKGRMLASFLLWRDETGYVMQLPRSLCETTRKRISMYILRSKVTASDATGSYLLFGVVGLGAAKQLEPLFKAIPTTTMAMTVAAGALLLRLDDTRLQIIVDQARGMEIKNALFSCLPPISETTWDWTNIHAGVPYITPATQDQFVPQMANLDLINGVSFSKGCYPGQEIVARMHYLGKLKQRMYLANIAGTDIPQPGDKLYSADTGEQATGMIVNTAPSPQGGHAALAVMHISSFKSGDVHLKSPAGPPLKFIALPYEIPS